MKTELNLVAPKTGSARIIRRLVKHLQLQSSVVELWINDRKKTIHVTTTDPATITELVTTYGENTIIR